MLTINDTYDDSSPVAQQALFNFTINLDIALEQLEYYIASAGATEGPINLKKANQSHTVLFLLTTTLSIYVSCMTFVVFQRWQQSKRIRNLERLGMDHRRVTYVPLKSTS